MRATAGPAHLLQLLHSRRKWTESSVLGSRSRFPKLCEVSLNHLWQQISELLNYHGVSYAGILQRIVGKILDFMLIVSFRSKPHKIVASTKNC